MGGGGGGDFKIKQHVSRTNGSERGLIFAGWWGFEGGGGGGGGWGT